MQKFYLITFLAVTITTLLFMAGYALADDNTFPATGNVGIGTTSPDSKLEVFDGRFKVGDGTNEVWIFGGSSGGLVAGHIGSVNNVPLAFFTNSSAPRMTISTNGNVGIGTTNPSHMLDVFTGGANVKTYTYGLETTVDTTGGWARAIRFRNENNNAVAAFGSLHGDAYISTGFDINNDPVGYLSPQLFIKSDGNVGIGTTSPGAGLEINKGSTNNLALLLNSSGPGWGSGIQFLNTGGAGLSYGIYIDNANPNKWHFANNNISLDAITIISNNNVGIGTTSPNNTLDVNGTIRAKEVKVETGWSDFVFEKDYNLRSLKQVESYIKENKHLPDIPSAKQVEEEGLSMTDMMKKQMQKIEELTLYVIEQNKQLSILKNENKNQSKEIAALEKELLILKK